MKAGKILAGVLVAIGVVAFLSVIIVKEVNQAIILQFGDPKRIICLLYTSPSPRDATLSRMPSSA